VERPVGTANFDVDKSAGTSLEHVGKIFRSHNKTSIPIYVRPAHELRLDIKKPHQRLPPTRSDASPAPDNAALDMNDANWLWQRAGARNG
jgi:hypothetical protein